MIKLGRLSIISESESLSIRGKDTGCFIRFCLFLIRELEKIFKFPVDRHFLLEIINNKYVTV